MTNTTQKDSNLFRLGGAFFAMVAAVILFQFGISIAVGIVAPAAAEHPLFDWLLSLVPIYVGGLPICCLILRKGSYEPLKKQRLSPSHFLLAAVVAFGVMLLGTIIGNTIMLTLSSILGKQISNPVQEIVMESHLAVSFVSTVIVAPIGEEFIFRRLIIDRTHRYGELPAILLSAAMFAAFHMNLYQFVYAFCVGTVLGYVYVKTGCLRYSVALHALINFIGGVVPSIVLKLVLPVVEMGTESVSATQIAVILIAAVVLLLQYVLLIGCLIATIVLACCHLHRIPLAQGEGGRHLWRSPFLILFFAVCAVWMILAVFI